MDIKPIKITKKPALKGEDGYKVFSVRIKEGLSDELDRISLMTNRSRNELIGLFLEHCVNNWELDEE